LLVHDAIIQDITRKAVRPSDSEEHVKFRSIQADGYSLNRTILICLDQANISWKLVSNSKFDWVTEATVAADLSVTTVLEDYPGPNFETIESNGHLPDLGSQLANMYGGVATQRSNT
jgi:hypothetical protein